MGYEAKCDDRFSLRLRFDKTTTLARLKRARLGEELLIACSHLDEYGKRLGLETQRALSDLSVYLDEAERAFQTGAYQEASLQLRHAAKILTEQIGRARSALEKVLFGGE